MTVFSYLVFFHGINNFEYLQEKVYYVQIEINDTNYIFFGAERFHNHLSVIDNKRRKNKGAKHSQTRVDYFILKEYLQFL